MNKLAYTFRYKLFRVVESLVALKNGKVNSIQSNDVNTKTVESELKYLWLYVSTIGELNAILPFVSAICEEIPPSGIVLLTDHIHYETAYRKVFPKAIVVNHGASGDIARCIERYKPHFFIISEIPCSLYDAPCRLSFRVIYQLKKLDVPIVLVNGWLYGDNASCRMDKIEKFLLSKAYLDSIDLYLVQTEEVRCRLVELGIRAEKVFTTGNIKFDSLYDQHIMSTPDDELVQFLAELNDQTRPIIVAGCVTNLSEQEELLDALVDLRNVHPETLLILAPRHPENTERMEILAKLLEERGLANLYRTEYYSGSIKEKAVVVLDTTGELRHTYSVGDVCYVGLNHNVLEPLALHKPVVVMGGWDEKYPSYPVYSQVLENGLILQADAQRDVCDLLLHSMERKVDYSVESSGILKGMTGAAERNLSLIKEKGLI